MTAPNFRLYVRCDGSTFIVGRITSVGRYCVVGHPDHYATRREAVAAGHLLAVCAC